jgi:hypothetical protein
MKILGIPNSTYYRYKSQIYQEDRELWNQIAKESLESRAYNYVSLGLVGVNGI